MKWIFLLAVVFIVMNPANAQTGNIGVGNNTPVTKLDVAGDLALREGTAISVSGFNPTVPVTLSAINSENSFYRIIGTPTGTMTLNSIANGVDGQIITLVNNTTIKLILTNNNTAEGILTPRALSQVIASNGSVTLQYSDPSHANRWFIINSTGSSLTDWIKATTTDEPAISTDHQYVTGNVGVGDFSTSIPVEKLEVLAGDAQITGTASGQIPSLHIYNGGNINSNEKSRINFWEPNGKGVWGMYIEHLDDDGMQTPSRGAGAVVNHLILGSIKNSIYTPIISMNDGNTYTGRVGIGTTDPSAIFHIYNGIGGKLSSTNVGDAIAVFDGGSGTANSRVAIGSNWTGSGTRPESKLEFWNNAFGGGQGNSSTISTLSSQGTGAGKVNGNLIFSTAKDATTPTEKMRLTSSGDIQMTGSTATTNKLWLETNNWVDPGTTGGAISVDNNSYKSMMIVGNNITGNKGQNREVQVWDYMKVNGYLTVGTQANATAIDPPSGTLRYNTTRKCMEYWDGTYWICMGAPTVQRVTVRDQNDENYRGTNCNGCSGWGGSYGIIYNFTVNNLYAGQKIMFYAEIMFDNNTKINNGFLNATKIYGNGYWQEVEVTVPGDWETVQTKVFPAQQITGTGNLTFSFESNTGITDVRITAVAY